MLEVGFRPAEGGHIVGQAKDLVNWDALEGGGHETEGREGRETAADIWVADEDEGEPKTPGHIFERCPRVGDRREMRSCAFLSQGSGGAIPEEFEERGGLGCCSGFGRNDEESFSRVQFFLEVQDCGRVRRIQDVEVEVSRGSFEYSPQHQRRQARSPHAEKESTSEAFGATDLDEPAYARKTLLHLLGRSEPTQPAGDFLRVIPPDGPILLPDSRDDPLLGQSG